MKKYLIIASVFILLIVTTAVFANVSGVFNIADFNLRIGNSTVELQYPIYVIDDRTYIPLRSLSEELRIPIHWDYENREVKMDIYNRRIQVTDRTPFREEGVIPDEETALIVGRAILERYAGRSLEYETEDRIFYLRVSFIAEFNGWSVSQTFRFKDGRGWGAGGAGTLLPFVRLNRNTGEVMYINTYTTSIFRNY